MKAPRARTPGSGAPTRLHGHPSPESRAPELSAMPSWHRCGTDLLQGFVRMGSIALGRRINPTAKVPS